MAHFPRLVIAGTHSGVGKTTVTLAILAALRKRGRQVQPFKAGPDFIDPGHHKAVTGRLSRNLDGWMLGEALNREIFSRAAADADLSIIEGMMGLFDGSSPVNEVGSTAELAKQLEAPVLLVIDGSAMARSAAAMVSGYAQFDPAVRVAGVIFNRVGSEGHYRLFKEAVEAETDVVVVGYLKPDPAVGIPDRHLGLVTAMEGGTDELYVRLGKAAAETIDLGRVETLARSCNALTPASPGPVMKRDGRTIRIGVAQDQAFCFYYPENLELLEAEGAELIPFSPLRDQSLPDDVAMVYLGGGYPELHGAMLAGNVPMRTAIRKFSASGGTIYAECGGMMYLTQAIRDFSGAAHEMVGLFQAEAVMRTPGLTLGYRMVEITRSCILGSCGVTARGHEFHYSTVVPKGPLAYACALTDALGNGTGVDGLSIDNVVALYTHLHFASQPRVSASLVESARRTKA
ncbi:MAG: cobyrinate a,c-diamide synthase [Nitrospira sp.]|nr:cobyrinate a,c-diamide synthase [Nitrospira sp.]MBH0185010.1 cobyrinate a,c-diamide synthase [Nitrospira sp.]